jgi:hypothetical protein
MALINILFKVDKSQVDASTASVNQAKAATDQLTASAAKLGQQGSKNNIQFGNTIEGVRLKMQQLRAQIDLTNQTDTKRLNGLINQYKAARAQLDEYLKKLKEVNNESKKADNGFQALAKGANEFYGAIKLIIGAQIVKQFVAMTIEATALAGRVEGVENAFKRAFPDGVLILNDLRQATKGTVTDFILMQRTLQATNLGVAVEKLPVLFEFAAARAQQTGESVDYLVDSIVRGIGRKSLLILDNLGLSAVRLKEQFNGASLASQSVADVTKAVGAIAQEELTKMGGFAENAAVKVDRLAVSWENLKLQASKFFQDGALVDYFNRWVTFSADVLEMARRNMSQQELLNERFVQSAAILEVNKIKQDQFNESNDVYLKNIQNVIKEKTHDLILTQKLIKFNKDNYLEIIKNIHAEKISFEAKKEKIAIAQQEQKSFNIQRLQYIEEIKLLNGVAKALELKVLNEAEGDGALDNLETLEEKVKDLNEQLQKTAPIQTQAGIAQAKIIKKQIDDTQILIDTIKDQIYWEDILRKRREEQKMGGTNIDLPYSTSTGTTKYDKTSSNNPLLATDKVSVDSIPAMELPAPIVPEDEWDKLKKAFDDNIKEIYDHGFQIANDQIQSLLMAEVSALDERIAKTKDFYDTQILLAGDNEKAKDRLRLEEDKKIKKLERERADREKKAALTGIVVNTALGIIKAIVTAATIYDGLVLAAGVAIEGASQYAIASRANYYAKGVIDLKGPGTGTSDSIPAMLSRGESVMTAQETADSNKTLKLIRAKKLNDKVLDNIMNKQNNRPAIGFDDARLLASNKRIEKAISNNDIVRKGSHIYEAKTEGENMRRYIRSKSLN